LGVVGHFLEMFMSLVLLIFMVRRLLESQSKMRFKSDWRAVRSEGHDAPESC